MFIDDGVSGARLDRPALDRLRDLAAEGAFEVLLGTVPDRLARRYASQVLLVEEFTRCGCEVVFVQHGLDWIIMKSLVHVRGIRLQRHS